MKLNRTNKKITAVIQTENIVQNQTRKSRKTSRDRTKKRRKKDT